MPQNDAASAERKVVKAMSRLEFELRERAPDMAMRHAQETIVAAQLFASARPTPQARMASTGLQATPEGVSAPSHTRVSGRGGNPRLGDVAGGSEYGSSIYRQFGPRQPYGAWMAPAKAISFERSRRKYEAEIDQAIRAAIAAADRGG